MSWDAPPPHPPEPEQPQQGQPFAPQDGWIAPAPQNPYEQAPPPYGQPGPYNQPGPYGQSGQSGPYDQPGPHSQPGPYNQQQPYEQTAPFGQYPTQPVTYDQYGQPLPPQPAAGPWGQYGAPAPFYGAPPPKRSRTGLFVGLGVGVAVIAAGVATAVALSSSSGTTNTASTGTTSSPTAANTATGTSGAASTAASTAAQQTARTVSVPQSAGSLHLLTNADTSARITQLKTQLSGNTAYSNPQIGFYGIGSSTAYSVWMLAEDTTNIATFQDSVNAVGVDAAAKEIATAANMKSLQTEPSGPLGGAMECGTLAENSVTVFACEWLDTTSFGWIYFMPSVTHAKALGYTLDLRAAAEK